MKIIPFKTLDGFRVWRNKNCALCRKDCPFDSKTNTFGSALCDMEEALMMGVMSNGYVDKSICKRANLHLQGKELMCKEFERRL